MRREDVVCRTSEEKRTRLCGPLRDDLSHSVVPVADGPSAVSEPAGGVLIGTTGALHHAVERQKRSDNERSHHPSPFSLLHPGTEPCRYLRRSKEENSSLGRLASPNSRHRRDRVIVRGRTSPPPARTRSTAFVPFVRFGPGEPRSFPASPAGAGSLHVHDRVRDYVRDVPVAGARTPSPYRTHTDGDVTLRHDFARTGVAFGDQSGRTPGGSDQRPQLRQVPIRSKRWLTAVKPVSAATPSRARSMLCSNREGIVTSSTVPQLEQTR